MTEINIIKLVEALFTSFLSIDFGSKSRFYNTRKRGDTFLMAGSKKGLDLGLMVIKYEIELNNTTNARINPITYLIMKTSLYLSLLGICATISMEAAIYTDAVADTVGGPGNYMDIASVEVTNDALNLYFNMSTVNNAAFVADGFARFMVGFDTGAGGDSAANAWSSLITMPGMDFFGGGFTDSGSGSAINFHSSALGVWPEWQSGDNTWVAYSGAVADSTGVSFSVPLSALGLSVGDSFNFDLYTGWSSGYAMDAVALNDGTLTQNDWASAYDSGTNVLSYTVTAVPEPSLSALSLGLVTGLLIFLRRRQKS